MRKERRNVKEVISRIATLGMLSALGFVLMAFAQFPYPAAPWLKIEISEIVVIIAYALYGFPGGIFVALVKAALNLAVRGLSGPFGIGDITALFTSIMFIIALLLTSHVFKWFKKGLLFRIFAYIFIAVFVSIILTGFNALFITPTYLSSSFTSCFNEGIVQNVTAFLTGDKSSIHNAGAYVGAVSLIYIPFNLMKVGMCCAIYELLFNRLIFVFMRKSEFFNKYFVGNIFVKDADDTDSVYTDRLDN